jgi:hypothetical protein
MEPPWALDSISLFPWFDVLRPCLNRSAAVSSSTAYPNPRAMDPIFALAVPGPEGFQNLEVLRLQKSAGTGASVSGVIRPRPRPVSSA